MSNHCILYFKAIKLYMSIILPEKQRMENKRWKSLERKSCLQIIINRMIAVSSTIEFIVLLKVSQLCPTVCDVWKSPWNSPGQTTGMGSFSLFQGIFPTQGKNLGFLHCRQILYHLSHKGSPRTEVGSLFLLQRIFLTQESNWGLLHCRRILYQLSYQGSPHKFVERTKWNAE